MRYYVIHGGDYIIEDFNLTEWPMPRGLDKTLPLVPPLGATGELPWKKLLLKPSQMNIKYEAIQQHKSQMDIMPGFMEAYVRTNELYSDTTIP